MQGVLCAEGLCPGGFLSREYLSRGVSVQGSLSSGMGLCPEGGLCLEVSQSRRSLFRGSLSSGVSVQVIFIQGVSLQRPPRIRKAGGMYPTGMLSCIGLF